jgi:hypothetical protein
MDLSRVRRFHEIEGGFDYVIRLGVPSFTQTVIVFFRPSSPSSSSFPYQSEQNHTTTMQVDVPFNPDVVAHDQPSAPGKERERDPILGGQVSNITNGINGTSWDPAFTCVS